MPKQRAYSYTRVSTAMQIEGYSLDAQKDRIESYAKSRDIDIIREFSDEGKSGKSIEGREEFKRMLDYVKAEEGIDYIIVYKLSRFGRNTRDILDTFELLQDYGVDLICVEDGIDSSKGIGKIIITILGALAELERDNIAVQTMEGRKEKARQGKWNGGQAPFGYKLVDGELKVVQEEAEIVRLIYKTYLDGNGMMRVANFLNDRGYRRKPYKNNTLKRFTGDFIKNVLDNEVYMGKIAFGKRQRQKKKGSRNQYEMVKCKDYILSEGIHEAIVSEEVWQKAAAKRKRTGVWNIKRHSLSHEHKLSGILKCPICGDSMYGNVSRKRKKGESGAYYKDTFYYCCKRRKLVDGKKCSFKRQPSEEKIDNEVYSALMSADMSDAILQEIRSKMLETSDKKRLEQELKELEKTKRTLMKQIELIGKRLDGLDVDDVAYAMKYDDLVADQDNKYTALARVKEEIRDTDHRLQKEIIVSNSLIDEHHAIQEYLQNWNRMSELEQKKFYIRYIERVELFEDFEKNDRAVKKIVFRFPLRFWMTDPLKGEIVPHKNAKLIKKDGKMIYDRWEYQGESKMTNEICWDKDGNVETVCLMSREEA